MREALQSRVQRFEELERMLSDPAVFNDPKQVRDCAKEHASLKPLVEMARQLDQVSSQTRQARDLLESSGGQGEMADMARLEIDELAAREARLKNQIEELLLGQDPAGDKSVIIEIRAGTGGAEAALFSADLYRMYSRYAAQKGWTMESLSDSSTEIGGFKEAIFGIEGPGVYRHLKFESGVHRVQRVPETEASGRIHTSTVTVAVLPQAEEVDIQIDQKDLRLDVYRSSGPGGQGVNTTDSAVRITHIPTGLVVTCQDERSQLKNKAKAMKVLRARLLESRQAQQEQARTQERRSQIGTGERSEKIRTYNFPDRRITDHRIGFTSHQLVAVLDGNLDEMIQPLLEAERKNRLDNATSS